MYLGGDFNCDAHQTEVELAGTLKLFLKPFNKISTLSQFIDTWHTHNIGTKKFAFHSHPHDTYARLTISFVPQSYCWILYRLPSTRVHGLTTTLKIYHKSDRTFLHTLLLPSQ